MDSIYIIENTFIDNYLDIHTSVIFTTNNLEKAKEEFSYYKKCCKIKVSKCNNEYILYQRNTQKYKIIDRIDDYR